MRKEIFRISARLGRVIETTQRLLTILGVLQTGVEVTGADLARRLAVTTRTVRADVDRLRQLGYEVDARPGPAGGYRLGAGRALPPLLLDDDEAAAVAVGLRTAAAGTVQGLAEASVRAMAKLEQTLPSRVRHRIATMHDVTVSAAGRGPAVAADVLLAVAGAARRHERLRFDYTGHDGARTRRDVEPYRLVHTGRRWYLLAWDVERGGWRSFRADRVEPRVPTGPRFAPRELPAEGAAAHVLRGVGVTAWPARARVRIHAPAARVAERIAPVGGVLTALGDEECELEAGGQSLLELAGYVASLDVPFEVVEPPELRAVARRMADRLAAAAQTTGADDDAPARG